MSTNPPTSGAERTEPPATPSREEVAKREIGHTEITPSAKRMLLLVFFIAILGVPLIQLAIEFREWRKSERAEGPDFRVADISRLIPEASRTWNETDGSNWNRLTRANASVLGSIADYEDSLEHGSFLRDAVLPPVQTLLVRNGAGNEKAYPGRDGWLFYRPSIDLLTGAGFLEPAALERRSLAGNERQSPPHPDPRPAILEFAESLENLGIQLVLVPTPVKSTIHPEKFAALRNELGRPLLNPSHEEFVRQMEEAGVMVFDPTEILFKRAHDGIGIRPTYLATDTHWLPDAMDEVATELTRYLRETIELPDAAEIYHREEMDVEGEGDIASMLQLPDDQKAYPKERVTIRKVRDRNGGLWSPDENAPVLLLGDSFSNIYSLEGMGWGESAGFAEQLSHHLGLSLDAILRNDSGAFATRQILAGDLARGRDRLRGKKVLVWQFAARELAFGDWKPIPLPDLPTDAPEIARESVPDRSGDGTWTATISAVVTQASAAPEAGVPYKDHIRSLHLEQIEVAEGSLPDPDAVVFVWDMVERELTPEARLSAGDKITLRLRPWDEVSATLERINRSELDDPDLMLAIPWWGEVIR